IETLVNKMAQEATRLRNAQRVSPLRVDHRGRVVFEIRDKISHARQAQSNHYWIFDYVYQLIDPARLESALQINKSIARSDAAVDAVRETPFDLRNDAPFAGRRLAHSQNVSRIAFVSDWILGAADRAVDDVREWLLARLFRHDKVRAQQPGDRFPAVARNRSIKAQQACLIAHVELPADPHDRDSLAHQETIAKFGLIGGEVGQAHDAAADAIGNLEEQRAAAAIQIFWFKNVNVSRELDQSLLVAVRFIEIDDDAVVRIARIDFEIDFAD